MRAERTRARDLKAVAEIRALQNSAAELAALRAAGDARDAAAKREEAQAEVAALDAGWARSLDDPALARAWFAAIGEGRLAERRAAEAEQAAAARLSEKRGAWQAATARADAASGQARSAARAVARRRDEARLGEIEDRAAGRGGAR